MWGQGVAVLNFSSLLLATGRLTCERRVEILLLLRIEREVFNGATPAEPAGEVPAAVVTFHSVVAILEDESEDKRPLTTDYALLVVLEDKRPLTLSIGECNRLR